MINEEVKNFGFKWNKDIIEKEDLLLEILEEKDFSEEK